MYAQLGQQLLARTTETSLQPRPGTRSCLSAQPPALAFWTGTRPQRWFDRVPEHCPVCILQAHGGDATPRFALWTINRFVAVTSQPLVELPWYPELSLVVSTRTDTESEIRA